MAGFVPFKKGHKPSNAAPGKRITKTKTGASKKPSAKPNKMAFKKG